MGNSELCGKRFPLHSPAARREAGKGARRGACAAKASPRWVIHSPPAKDQARTSKRNLLLPMCGYLPLCCSLHCLLPWILQLPKFHIKTNNKLCCVTELLPRAARSMSLGEGAVPRGRENALTTGCSAEGLTLRSCQRRAAAPRLQPGAGAAAAWQGCTAGGAEQRRAQ